MPLKHKKIKITELYLDRHKKKNNNNKQIDKIGIATVV